MTDCYVTMKHVTLSLQGHCNIRIGYHYTTVIDIIIIILQVYTANGFMVPPFAASTSLYPVTAGIRPVKMEIPGSTTDWYVCDSSYSQVSSTLKWFQYSIVILCGLLCGSLSIYLSVV